MRLLSVSDSFVVAVTAFAIGAPSSHCELLAGAATGFVGACGF